MSAAVSFLGHDLANAEVDALVYDAVVWANQHGLVVALRDKDVAYPHSAVIHVPLALLPVTYPRDRFQQAQGVQPAMNALVEAVAQDEQYLEDTLAAAARHDTFTASLLGALRATRAARAALSERQVSLGILRSDYMLDAPSGRFLQVELNTIASSFGCLSALTSQLHAYLAARTQLWDAACLPHNNTLTALPAALAAAVAAAGVPGGVVVMVVQPGERNAYDQQWLQLRLWEAHGLRTLRLSLAEIARVGRVEADGTLTLDLAASAHSGAHSGARTPVACVYFRAGYTPDDYPSDTEWTARRLIDSSTAARCPTLAYQLAGCKKVQQDLARPGVLERFVADASDVAALRECFAGLWGLEDPADPPTQQVIQDALRDPDSYVLKPQREGGGNNLYGAELRARLQEGGEGLAAYILMQRIRPPPSSSVLVRNGEWASAEALSELGIFGVFLARGAPGAREVLLNEQAGHLVRTKRSNANEGGVAAGYAVLDSPYLV